MRVAGLEEAQLDYLPIPLLCKLASMRSPIQGMLPACLSGVKSIPKRVFWAAAIFPRAAAL
jgi:hypothetical protein